MVRVPVLFWGKAHGLILTEMVFPTKLVVFSGMSAQATVYDPAVRLSLSAAKNAKYAKDIIVVARPRTVYGGYNGSVGN